MHGVITDRFENETISSDEAKVHRCMWSTVSQTCIVAAEYHSRCNGLASALIEEACCYTRRKVQTTAKGGGGGGATAAEDSNSSNNSRGRQPVDNCPVRNSKKNAITESSLFCTSRWTRIYAAARTAGRLVGTIRRTEAAGGRTRSSRRSDLHAPDAVR